MPHRFRQLSAKQLCQEIPLMEEYALYLDFLRFCLHEDMEIPSIVSSIDWEKLYDFARSQTVESTYWHGIERLDRAGKIKLDENTVLTWMARIKKLERRSAKTFKKAAWTWKNFRHEGFRSCILKGQGNALLYPKSVLRTSGDIDIWVEGGDEKVIAYIDSVCPGFKRSYHHIDFIKTGKIPIEVHYRPSWLNNPWHNRRLQQWFEEHSEECFTNKREDYGFCVPTFRFNVVYLLSHMYCHLISEGVGLRHLVDYYHLLSNSPDAPRPTEEELRHLGLLKIAGAVMWVLHEKLGLDSKLLVCQPNERCGKIMLNEILEGGNFGKFDERILGGDSKNAVRHNAKRILRDIRLFLHFPSECFWEPYFRIWHFVWRYRHKPPKLPQNVTEESDQVIEKSSQ